jgi:hypothetical protein
VKTSEILLRLQFVAKVRDGWMARCPAHDDKKPSLSVSTGDDGRTLLHCHAGCTLEAICAAMNMQSADFFESKTTGCGTRKKLMAKYPYNDAAGNLLFEVVRFEPKTFRQRRPDAKGGWIWNMAGVERVVFRLPELIAEIEKGLPVFVCEGEKDVLTMVDKGFAATCNAGGAGKWQKSYSEALRGADVMIVADKDTAGRKHAIEVADKLLGVARAVKVIELPDVAGKPVKDATDFFRAGGQSADLDELAQTSLPYSGHSEKEGGLEESENVDLPAIADAADFLEIKIETPKELVSGLLHQGSKLVLGGGSKTFKTWTLIDLALAVATGKPWLSFETKKGRVLFLNFEIQPAFFQQRIRAVAEAKKITLEHGMIDVWNLRGQAAGYGSLFPRITEHLKSGGYELIVLDPIYKCYGDVDENSAGAVAGLMNAIEALAVAAGAAVAFGAHYSKGNQSGKEAVDRISGSGVFARDPDSILNLTRHEEPNAFTVEFTLRNFEPLAPFVVRWQFPLMRRADDLDPSKLKQSKGRPKIHTVKRILDCLGNRNLTTTQWQKRASSENGVPKTQFYILMDEAKRLPGLTQNQKGQWLYEEVSDKKQ